MSSHLTLGAAADERKARLAKLKSLKRKQPEEETAVDAPTGSPTPGPEVNKTYLSGRNYDPETRGPKLGFEAPPTQNLDKPTLEAQASEIEEEVRNEAQRHEQDDKGVDLFQLQPKKPNWDLKRDLSKKMAILDVRTENAIASLVRERIHAAQETAKRKPDAENDASYGSSELGMEGIALTEAIKIKEREDEEEQRRALQDDDLG